MSSLNWQFLSDFDRISYYKSVQSSCLLKLTSTQSALW